jgi:hypothetical protein
VAVSFQEPVPWPTRAKARELGQQKVIRSYTRIVGLGLVLFGLAGLVDIVGLEPPANIFHLGVGGLFAYAGFMHKDVSIVRTIVGGLGLLLLLVKGTVIVAPLLWGDAPLFAPVEITCLVVGILSVLAARFLPSGTSQEP